MLVTAAGLALMTTLQAGTSYWWPGVFMFIVGVGSGMFNSPNTAAMMGVVAPHRRGIASGARVLVQNTGAVLSIAFVMAVVTYADPDDRPVQRLLRVGDAHHLEPAGPVPLEHAHRAVVPGRPCRSSARSSSFARPKHVGHQRSRSARPRPRPG